LADLPKNTVVNTVTTVSEVKNREVGEREEG
jgi:hypothetical protein